MIHSLISFQYDHPLTGGPIRCSDTSQAALTKKIVIHDKEANMVSNPIPHFLTICKDPHAAPSPLPAPAPCSQRSQRCSHSSSFHTSENPNADRNEGKPRHTHCIEETASAWRKKTHATQTRSVALQKEIK